MLWHGAQRRVGAEIEPGEGPKQLLDEKLASARVGVELVEEDEIAHGVGVFRRGDDTIEVPAPAGAGGAEADRHAGVRGADGEPASLTGTTDPDDVGRAAHAERRLVRARDAADAAPPGREKVEKAAGGAASEIGRTQAQALQSDEKAQAPRGQAARKWRRHGEERWDGSGPGGAAGRETMSIARDALAASRHDSAGGARAGPCLVQGAWYNPSTLERTLTAE